MSCFFQKLQNNELPNLEVRTIRLLTLEAATEDVKIKKIVVLKNFAKVTGKHLCQSLSFNKVPGLKPVTLLKKRPWHRCFPVNFTKFLRTPFL